MAKPNIALNDHRLDLITPAASIAVGVRGAARTELRAKTTAIVPIMIRSAQKEDLFGSCLCEAFFISRPLTAPLVRFRD